MIIVQKFLLKDSRNLPKKQVVLHTYSYVRLQSLWSDCPSSTYPDSPAFGFSWDLDPFDDGLRDGVGIDLDTAGFDVVALHLDSVRGVVREKVAADWYWQIDRFAIHRIPNGVEAFHLDIFRDQQRVSHRIDADGRRQGVVVYGLYRLGSLRESATKKAKYDHYNYNECVFHD